MTSAFGTKSFVTDRFLLSNKYAERLYFEYARNMPIIDYHNHLSPAQLADNHQFANITEIWLEGDHYKWRAMRTLGISEAYVTGDADPFEKFLKWGDTVPYTIGNPLFHWTHLELLRYFGIEELLTPQNAKALYHQLSHALQDPSYRVQGLVKKMNVEVLCTTEDPTDTLEHHQKLQNSNFDTKVSTAFRPDRALMIDSDEFLAYLEKVGNLANMTINSFDTLLEALYKRMDYFHENGCRLSDHGLPYMYCEAYSASEIKTIFEKRLLGKLPSSSESIKFKSALLFALAERYHKLGWVQQYHLGPLRNTNSRMYHTLGADTGCDSIGDYPQALTLAKFLDKLDQNECLAKTILYNLNPRDNAVFATMAGNFNDGSIKGKVQWGSAWWFLDQKDGIEAQLRTLSSMGLLSCFVGMLTDSRSFLSFPRHEYFRRILCNNLGTQIENGELPTEMDWIGRLVQDICYYNAKNYFNVS